MTNLDDELEGGCLEEELSDVQKKAFEDANKEYERAMVEVSNVQKDATSIIKSGPVWTIKSTCQVKLRNSAIVNRPAAPTSSPATAGQNLALNALLNKLPNTQIAKNVATSSAILGTPTSSSITIIQPAIKKPQPIPVLATIGRTATTVVQHQHVMVPPPAVGVNKNNVPANLLQQASLPSNDPPPFIDATPMPAHPRPTTSNPKPVVNEAARKPVAPAIAVPINSKSVSSLVAQYKKNDIPMPEQSNQPIPPQPVSPPASKKLTPEDPKLAKNLPSLSVTVRPSKAVPEAMNAKKRDTLDTFVKSRLVLDARRFAEWLMQVGMLRSQQYGTCRIHSASPAPLPLQLRMYSEGMRFPHSGGYVWITKCCDRNFVSIFRDSIFEDAPHGPTVLLKLIYHWACQTSITNVIQWVKVDHAYLSQFYGLMRAVCTVDIHSSTPVFGAASKNGRVEVGVISLGTTSSDGKRRDVKVEVLGIYDQETSKIRLRAVEPVAGDNRARTRFGRILEPLSKWVSTQSIILTDFTVDRGALEELGFYHVVQKTLNTVAADDRLNNRTIMEYLRRTVPKVFQNTLSVLSTTVIQQFLDELVWRENHGTSSSDAFHNMIRDIGIQVRAETGINLIKRLPLVNADPWKDWSVVVTKAPVHVPLELSALPVVPPNSMKAVAQKRPATYDESGPAKEPRRSNYFATLTVSKKDAYVDSRDMDIVCQHTGCMKVMKSNLLMMSHLRQHLFRDLGMSDLAEWTEQCNYCLEAFANADQRKKHEDAHHVFLQSFTVKDGKEDSAVLKDYVCLICHEKLPFLRALESHMDKMHVSCEMPYRCRVCYYQASAHSLLVDHFYETHAASKNLLCPVCLDTFPISGDNQVKGLETGHLQYLTHLSAHMEPLSGTRHRCKKCALIFLQYEQLRFHVRTDHGNCELHSCTRPFSFTMASRPSVTKIPGPTTAVTVPVDGSSGIKPPSAATPAVISQATAGPSPVKITAPSRVTVNAGASVSNASKALPSTRSSNVSGASASKPVNPVAAAKSVRTYSVKDPIFDVAGVNIARRFPNLTLTEEAMESGVRCIECNESMKKKNHFVGYLCCTLCRYSTCCGFAMKKHHVIAHQKSRSCHSEIYDLSMEVQCQCGFTSCNGLEVSEHMSTCESGNQMIYLPA